MKRLLVAIMIVGLTAGAFGMEASAKKRKKVKRIERTETAEYSTPGFVRTEGGLSNVCAKGTGCLWFPATPKDRFFSVSATDKSGTPTPIVVTLEDGTQEFFCGSTDGPMALAGATEVNVSVGVDADCQGIATQGTVEITFSNRK